MGMSTTLAPPLHRHPPVSRSLKIGPCSLHLTSNKFTGCTVMQRSSGSISPAIRFQAASLRTGFEPSAVAQGPGTGNVNPRLASVHIRVDEPAPCYRIHLPATRDSWTWLFLRSCFRSLDLPPRWRLPPSSSPASRAPSARRPTSPARTSGLSCKHPVSSTLAPARIRRTHHSPV